MRPRHSAQITASIAGENDPLRNANVIHAILVHLRNFNVHSDAGFYKVWDGILVDGYHRWQAHVREGVETIDAIDLSNLADAEIIRESIKRNASHGQQLSRADKKSLASKLWPKFADLEIAERVAELADMFSVDDATIRRWTKDAKDEEKQAQEDLAWDLSLNYETQETIAEKVGVSVGTVNGWLSKMGNCPKLNDPLDSRQHFDIWNFHLCKGDAGAASYFGRLAPQPMENLLWFSTEPGDTVADLFAGSGTTIDHCKKRKQPAGR